MKQMTILHFLENLEDGPIEVDPMGVHWVGNLGLHLDKRDVLTVHVSFHSMGAYYLALNNFLLAHEENISIRFNITYDYL